jgi:nucleoside 2-deoxyribosyltransferase
VNRDMRKVYLSGPVSGLKYNEATEWREDAIEMLIRYNIRGVSPMRSKEHLDNGGILGEADKNPLTTDNGLIVRDRYDVLNSDVLLANFLGATEVSICSIFELGWADVCRKPIATVMEREGNVRDHKFVREVSGFRVDSLERGVAVVFSILNY